VIQIFGGRFDWRAAGQLPVGGMGTTFDAVEGRRQLAANSARSAFVW
jgi:hypothetical protein